MAPISWILDANLPAIKSVTALIRHIVQRTLPTLSSHHEGIQPSACTEPPLVFSFFLLLDGYDMQLVSLFKRHQYCIKQPFFRIFNRASRTLSSAIFPQQHFDFTACESEGVYPELFFVVQACVIVFNTQGLRGNHDEKSHQSLGSGTHFLLWIAESNRSDPLALVSRCFADV